MGAKRVLIVDDALFMRKRIGDVAREAGWEVAGEAENGERALELYQEQRPDLVTLDIVMPELDGVATLTRLMQLDVNARVVMVSAVNQKEKLAECIQAGAMDFIVKPFEKSLLREFFQHALQVDGPSEGIAS